MKIVSVYKITNIINGLFYIGSSKDTNDRWSAWRWALNNNRSNSSFLQADWNKYGKDSFKFEIIELCDINNRLEREQYWIDKFQSYDRSIGYNIEIRTDKRVRSEYVLEKIRQKHLGKIPWNKGTKGLQVAWNKGQTKETNLIIKTYGEAGSKTKKGTSSSFKGKHHTEEAKEKNRQAHLGKPNPKKGKHKIISLECVICKTNFEIVFPSKIRKTCSKTCKNILNSLIKKGTTTSKKGKKFAAMEIVVCRCGCGEQFEDYISQGSKFKNEEHYHNFQIGKPFPSKKE